MRTPFILILLLVCHMSYAYEFTVNPVARVRYESLNSPDLEGDHRAFVGSRFWLLGTVKHEDYTFVFQPQYARIWGQEIDGLTASGGLIDPEVHVHQAYMQTSLYSHLNLKLGRQELVYGDELILGAVGWSNIGRSFDALKVEIEISNLSLDVFASKLVDRNAVGSSTGDIDLYGIYFKMQNQFEILKESDLYVFSLNDKSLAPRQDIFAAGVRFTGSLYSFDQRFEAIYQKMASFNEGQVDAEVGLSHEFLGRLALNYFMATEHYNQMFPTAHKWLGIGDMVARRNIQGYQLKFQKNWNAKFKTELAYYNMFRYSSSDTAYRMNGTTVLGDTGLSSKNIAQEYDLIFNYAYDKNLSYQIGGAMFVPKKYLKESGKNQTYTFGYLQIMLKL